MRVPYIAHKLLFNPMASTETSTQEQKGEQSSETNLVKDETEEKSSKFCFLCPCYI
jgi:hypothetical protein